MTSFIQTFRDKSRNDVPDMEFTVQPSHHRPGAVFLLVRGPVDREVSGHLSKADALKIAEGIRSTCEQVRDAVTYRGVEVPDGQHMNGRVDDSFAAGVDAALSPTAGRNVPACGASRNNDPDSNYPCVLEPEHSGSHLDKDADPFIR